MHLDDVERLRDDDGRDGSRHARRDILTKSRIPIVRQAEEFVLRERRTAKKSERSRSVPHHRPIPPAVQSETLIGENPDKAPLPEGFWVGLTFDLEDVEREEDDFANADKTACCGVSHGLTVLLSEDVDEGLLVAGIEKVVGKGLTAELVCRLVSSPIKL